MTEIAIYQTPSAEVGVRLDQETVWLRMEQMAELFGRDRTVVGVTSGTCSPMKNSTSDQCAKSAH